MFAFLYFIHTRNEIIFLSLTHQEEKDEVSPLTPRDVDWDSLYEEAVEEEEVDMKSHGSVITHLLSQESLYLHWNLKPNIFMN